MTNHMRLARGAVTLGLALYAPTTATAQDATTVTPARVAQSAAPSQAESAVWAVLGRSISIQLPRSTLRQALDAISRAGGVRLGYSEEKVPLDRQVSLVSNTITVRDALAVVLEGTGLAVFVTPGGWVTLEPSNGGDAVGEGEGGAHQATGTITGWIHDSATAVAIPQVTVRVEGTGFGTLSGADGKYVIAGVPVGEYHVTARRVGYLARTRAAVVVDGQATSLNFALNQPATRLDEVVTTALGEQRRYEVGNVISTINADSITPTAPITSLTDLISSRAPGVEVLETSGLTGSGEAIRIRGLGSLTLQNDPILIVDGVRQDNAAGSDIAASLYGVGNHPTPTRLNDIDFADIETIDILKGPSASTEYGTDAANGVIVITTKHGVAGPPQWHVSAEQAGNTIPTSFPEGYYSWGHTTDGLNTPVNCPLVGFGNGIYQQYGYYGQANGGCVVDSVTRWQPLNHSYYSGFGAGNRAKYDAQVSGGSDAIRYFIAGGLSNELGVTRLPPAFHHLADSLGITLPSTAFKSNTQAQRSVRLNTTVRLGSTGDLGASGAYLSTYQQTPEASQLLWGSEVGQARRDAAHSYGYFAYATPLDQAGDIASQNTNRLTGALTGNWRPTSWFVGHATVGLDHGSQGNQALSAPQIAGSGLLTNFGPALGVVSATNDIYSADVRGTATVSPHTNVRAATSVGLQVVDSRVTGQSALVFSITSVNQTLNGQSGATVSQVGTRQATLGGYGEEQLSFADRLFLTGAVRLDAGSGFGGAINSTLYPKANVSWVAINTGSTTLRLRGAFGEAGIQPQPGAASLLFTPGVAWYGGQVIPTYGIQWPGNPHLRPERSIEFEGGGEVNFWSNRLGLDFTGYSKTTHDALVNQGLGWDASGYTYQQNIGEVRTTGVEATATATVVDGRSVSWVVVLNGSVAHNKLISLAPGVLAQAISFIWRQAPGYPLYGLWARRETYADANHNGMIDPNEVSLADSASYIGPSQPTQEVSLSTHLGFGKGAVVLSGLVDYRGGYRLENGAAYWEAGTANRLAQNVPTAPLWLQARSVAVDMFGSVPSSFIEDASFVRIREVGATYAVPRSWTRRTRVSTLSITAAVRNLALWTRYTGLDPETTNNSGLNVQQSFAGAANGSVVNNDIRSDYVGSVPLARYWVVRLNLGL